MISVEDLLHAYRTLLNDPAAPADVRERFWADLALTSTAEAVAEVRRLVEFHLSDEPEPPADLEPPVEPNSDSEG